MKSIITHTVVLAVSTLLSGYVTTVSAQEEIYSDEESMMLLYQDEEMISIATGTEKPIHLAPSVASLITENDIKAMGARTLDEALESVPGLHVSADPYRQSAIYSIRGIHTGFNPQVVMLLNGHPINEAVTGGRPPLFKLPTANISRIEIMRGPGSAVYGADAFAGVINVITKDAQQQSSFTSGVRSGSFDTHDFWIRHGGELAGYMTALSFEYSTSKGDDDRIIESDLQANVFNPEASLTPGAMSTGYEVFNTSLNLEKNNWNLWLNSWNIRDAGLGVGATQSLDLTGRLEADQYIIKLDYENDSLDENWQLASNLTLRHFDQQVNYMLFPPGAIIPICNDGGASAGNIFDPDVCSSFANITFTEGLHGNPGLIIDHSAYEVAFTNHQFSKHLIRLAAGVKHDKLKARETKNFGPGVIDGTVTPIGGALTDVSGTDDIYVPNVSRTVRYLSLQDEWKLGDDWELTSGIRYDHYSDFGDTVNPRLALVWAMDYNLTSKLLYGRAFRAPSFTDLYFINNPASIGNPSLDPEVIDMVEVVFDYRPNFDTDIILNLFRYQIDDLIDYDSSGIAQNMHNQRGYGMELDMSYRASNTVDLLGNFALQHSKNRNSLEAIHDAPGRQVSLSLRVKATDTCSVNTMFNWVANRKREAGDSRAPVDDYATVNLNARCSELAGTNIEIAAGVRNLFERDIREPSSSATPNDYPQEGRSLYVEFSYKL